MCPSADPRTPDKPLSFTFCRLRYDNIRRARECGWGDDYPQAHYNFMVRLATPALRTSPPRIPIDTLRL